MMLSPRCNNLLIAEAPEVFIPVAGGWGRRGWTHIRLAKATPQQLLKGLQAAWDFECIRTIIRDQPKANVRRSAERALSPDEP
jgi:hypothetical protein